MRLAKEILQIPACAIGLALLGGAISFATAIICEEAGLVRYPTGWDSAQARFGSLLLGATAGGLLGFAWSAKRTAWRPAPVLEVDDEVW